MKIERQVGKKNVQAGDTASASILIIGQGFIGKNLFPDDARVIRCAHANALGAVESYRPSVIVNCAFDPRGYTAQLKLEETLDYQLLPHVAALNAKYVYLSTRAVYAPEHQLNATEDSPLRPTSIYGQNKLVIEQLVRNLLGTTKTLILRLPNVFGIEVNEQRNSFFKVFLTNLLDRKEIIFDFKPETIKDFIYIHDLNEIIAALLEKSTHGVYNVGYGHPTECVELIHSAQRKFGDIKVKIDGSKKGEEFFLDNSKLKKLLPNFFVQKNLKIALNKMLDELCAVRGTR